MAYAPNYSPTTDFSQDQANNVSGRSTARTANLDAEFDNISTSINALNNNLKNIQRSDNKLKDGVVEMHTLSDEVMMALGSTPEAVALIIQAVIDAQTSANEAAASAASIRVDYETYAAIPTLATPCFVFVAADETNGDLPTVYFFDGSELQWIPSVGV